MAGDRERSADRIMRAGFKDGFFEEVALFSDVVFPFAGWATTGETDSSYDLNESY